MPAVIAIALTGFCTGAYASAAFISGLMAHHNQRVLDNRKREFEELEASLKTES